VPVSGFGNNWARVPRIYSWLWIAEDITDTGLIVVFTRSVRRSGGDRTEEAGHEPEARHQSAREAGQKPEAEPEPTRDAGVEASKTEAVFEAVLAAIEAVEASPAEARIEKSTIEAGVEPVLARVEAAANAGIPSSRAGRHGVRAQLPHVWKSFQRILRNSDA
jgi:hypothetical protein